MTYSYKVEVTAGTSYTWTVTNETEADYGLVDGLTVTRKIPEGDFWPAQPAPAVARFSVVAEAWADVDELQIGMPVQVAYYSPSTDTDALEDFAGRIAGIEVQPHAFGVIVAVTCVDYLADIAECSVRAALNDGSVYTIFTTVSGVLDVIWDRSGIPHDLPTYSGYLPTPAQDPLILPPFDGGNLSDLVEHFLSQWIWDVTGVGWPDGPGRFVIVQGTTGPDLDDFHLAPVWREEPSISWIPTLTLSAGLVDVGGTFARRKGSESIDVVEVAYYNGTEAAVATNQGDPGLPRATKPVALLSEADAQLVADFYVPSGTPLHWTADAFTWRLYADDEGAYLPQGYALTRLGFPVEIEDIDSRWCPTGTTYRGVLAGYILTIAAGKPTLVLDVRPEVHAAP